jgi:hypothetical protein
MLRKSSTVKYVHPQHIDQVESPTYHHNTKGYHNNFGAQTQSTIEILLDFGGYKHITLH